ncbi:hypothetical protein CCMA1212_001313 [Trichoderma ghanense]|uniref:Uncharacterized protein n=1 Tax=Trichoderma ghanense TaxID=65468 RepID=A0ABY2HGU7_9HYPO
MRHSAEKRRLRLRPWSCALVFCCLSVVACALPTTSVSAPASSLSQSSAPAASTLASAAAPVSADNPGRSPSPAPAPAAAPSPAHGSEFATPQATETSTEGAAAATRTAEQQQKQQQQQHQQQSHPLPLDLQNLAVEQQASPASEPLSVPPYKPIVTPPPDQDAQLAKMGYSMTTFYTCDTVGGKEHCGWHVPVLKADAPTRKTDVRVVLAVVSCLAGILAWGLV